MTDPLLTPPDKEEALSRAYTHAIAAGAGYVAATMDFDRDGVDMEIKAGGLMRPAVALQLKGTSRLGRQVNGEYRFALKRRNYDLLRIQTQVPRILVVLDLPEDHERWLEVTPEQLVLRRCAYWTSLAGAPETDNSESVTVSVPASNSFSVEGLPSLMEKSRTGSVK